MEKNYGIAISNRGDFQIINVAFEPGISDSFSYIRNESFILYVAPAEVIDKALKLNVNSGNYNKTRQYMVDNCPHLIRLLILSYFKDERYLCNNLITTGN